MLSQEQKNTLYDAAILLSQIKQSKKVSIPISTINGHGVLSFESNKGDQVAPDTDVKAPDLYKIKSYHGICMCDFEDDSIKEIILKCNMRVMNHLFGFYGYDLNKSQIIDDIKSGKFHYDKIPQFGPKSFDELLKVLEITL